MNKKVILHTTYTYIHLFSYILTKCIYSPRISHPVSMSFFFATHSHIIVAYNSKIFQIKESKLFISSKMQFGFEMNLAAQVYPDFNNVYLCLSP